MQHSSTRAIKILASQVHLPSFTTPSIMASVTILMASVTISRTSAVSTRARHSFVNAVSLHKLASLPPEGRNCAARHHGMRHSIPSRFSRNKQNNKRRLHSNTRTHTIRDNFHYSSQAQKTSMHRNFEGAAEYAIRWVC